MQTGGSRRVPALDGIRGLAVVLVTVSHAGFPLLKLGAIVGVTLFFVLSGYLITGLLLDEHERTGTIRFGRFYRNRALRLLPALGLLIVVWAPLAVATGSSPGDVGANALQVIFYVKNLALMTGWNSTGLEQTWSLSLEEQFYLLWPLLLLLVVRSGRRPVMAVAGVGIVASLVVRFAIYGWHTAGGYERAYYLPQATVWALLVGAVLACAIREWPAMRASRALGTLALVGLLAASSLLGMTGGVLHSGLNYGPRLLAGPIAAALAAVLILAVTTSPAPRWAVHPLTVFFGAISYGLYLWHATLIGLVETRTGHGDFTHLIVGSVCAVAATGIAWLSFRHVETPFLRMKRHQAAPPGQLVEPASVTVTSSVPADE